MLYLQSRQRVGDGRAVPRSLGNSSGPALCLWSQDCAGGEMVHLVIYLLTGAG